MVLAVIVLTGATSHADTIAAGDILSNGDAILDGFLVSDDISDETFTIQGDVDLKFTLNVDEGVFLFSFGFYDVTDIASPFPTNNSEQAAYMTEVIQKGTLVFEEYSDGGDTRDPGALPSGSMVTHSVPAGTELGFYLIPNNSRSTFLGDSAAHFLESNLGYDNTLLDLFFGDIVAETPSPSFEAEHQPMSSQDEANFDGHDQLIVVGSQAAANQLAAGDTLVLSWEDLSRADDFAANAIIADQGEIDFDDLGVRIEVNVPEPATLVLLSGGGLALLRRKRF